MQSKSQNSLSSPLSGLTERSKNNLFEEKKKEIDDKSARPQLGVILSQLAFDKKYRDLGLIEATVDTGEAPRLRLDQDKFKGQRGFHHGTTKHGVRNTLHSSGSIRFRSIDPRDKNAIDPEQSKQLAILEKQLRKLEYEEIEKEKRLQKFKDELLQQQQNNKQQSPTKKTAMGFGKTFGGSIFESTLSAKSLNAGKGMGQSIVLEGGLIIDRSIHKGYDQFLNPQKLEDLQEKMDFLDIKLKQLEKLDEIEDDEQLILSQMYHTLKQQRLYDNRKYQHRLPEIQLISRMSDSMKQAYFLKQISKLHLALGSNQCKETLVDAKIYNQDKIKVKKQELGFVETESKEIKSMKTEIIQLRQKAKNKLKELRTNNDALDIDKLKKKLYDQRKKEMNCLVLLNLFSQLIKYSIEAQQFEDANDYDGRKMSMFELQMANEQYKNEKIEYEVSFTLETMTPEISIIVSQKYEKILTILQFDQMNFLVEYIEKSYIFNQSLQLKCNEITADVSRRKTILYQLQNLLKKTLANKGKKERSPSPTILDSTKIFDDMKPGLFDSKSLSDKKAKTMELEVFLKNLFLLIRELVCKISAMLVHIKVSLPQNIHVHHFPKELVEILRSYTNVPQNTPVIEPPKNQTPANKLQQHHPKSIQDGDSDSTYSRKNGGSNTNKPEMILKNFDSLNTDLKKRAQQMNLQINTQFSLDLNQKTISPSKLRKESSAQGLDSGRINKLKEIWLQIEEREKQFYSPENNAYTIKTDLKKILWVISMNRRILVEEIDQQNLKDIDYELSQKKFNQHYEQAYQSLNQALKSPFKNSQVFLQEQTKQDFEGEQEVNENSFFKHDYEDKKQKIRQHLRFLQFGKQKKKSKVPLKERRKIKFFENLGKRGLNNDKQHHHKTNVKYIQISKQINTFYKTEDKFITNQLDKKVKDFEATIEKILTGPATTHHKTSTSLVNYKFQRKSESNLLQPFDSKVMFKNFGSGSQGDIQASQMSSRQNFRMTDEMGNPIISSPKNHQGLNLKLNSIQSQQLLYQKDKMLPSINNMMTQKGSARNIEDVDAMMKKYSIPSSRAQKIRMNNAQQQPTGFTRSVTQIEKNRKSIEQKPQVVPIVVNTNHHHQHHLTDQNNIKSPSKVQSQQVQGKWQVVNQQTRKFPTSKISSQSRFRPNSQQDGLSSKYKEDDQKQLSEILQQIHNESNVDGSMTDNGPEIKIELQQKIIQQKESLRLTSNTNSANGSNRNGRSSSVLANINNAAVGGVNQGNLVRIEDHKASYIHPQIEMRIEGRMNINPSVNRLYEKPYLATSSVKIKL